MTPSDETRYELTLFVSGASALAAHAITNATRLCETHLRGRHRLSVIDVHQEPTAGVRSGVFVTPTLFRNSPLPVRKVVGDLSDVGKVLRALELPVAASGSVARS